MAGWSVWNSSLLAHSLVLDDWLTNISCKVGWCQQNIYIYIYIYIYCMTRDSQSRSELQDLQAVVWIMISYIFKFNENASATLIPSLRLILSLPPFLCVCTLVCGAQSKALRPPVLYASATLPCSNRGGTSVEWSPASQSKDLYSYLLSTWFLSSTPRVSRHFMQLGLMWGFPGGSEGKASAYNVGDLGSIPGSGRSPGEGNGNPLQYSCLGNPMDWEAW